jgi:mRNA interferase YafQ
MEARGGNMGLLVLPVTLLLNCQPLPRQYKDHPLKGKWKGHREFHVEPDWLVIYREDNQFLVLVRTGTHDDLFK